MRSGLSVLNLISSGSRISNQGYCCLWIFRTQLFRIEICHCMGVIRRTKSWNLFFWSCSLESICDLHVQWAKPRTLICFSRFGCKHQAEILNRCEWILNLCEWKSQMCAKHFLSSKLVAWPKIGSVLPFVGLAYADQRFFAKTFAVLVSGSSLCSLFIKKPVKWYSFLSVFVLISEFVLSRRF